MSLQRELENLGFSSNEVRIYTTLLQTGPCKAGNLSKAANLERSSTYNALKRLIQEGLVSVIRESQNQTFSAASPEKIIGVFEEKQERAKLLVPKLKNLQTLHTQTDNIKRFQGIKGIKTVLNDILTTCSHKQEYVMFGSQNQLSEILPTFATIFVAKKDRKKIPSRILMKEQFKDQTKRSKFTKVRYVPNQVISPAVTTVYKNKIAIILYQHPPEAIIIENPLAAQSYQSYFEFMWARASR